MRMKHGVRCCNDYCKRIEESGFKITFTRCGSMFHEGCFDKMTGFSILCLEKKKKIKAFVFLIKSCFHVLHVTLMSTQTKSAPYVTDQCMYFVLFVSPWLVRAMLFVRGAPSSQLTSLWNSLLLRSLWSSLLLMIVRRTLLLKVRCIFILLLDVNLLYCCVTSYFLCLFE